MGKKSLLSSTSNKKNTGETDADATTGAVKETAPSSPKSKTAPKKTAPQKGTVTPKRTTAAKKTAAPKKKAAPRKKPAVSAASGAKKAPAKTTRDRASAAPKDRNAAAPRKEPVSIRTLLARKFDTAAPEKLYTPPLETRREAEISAPPFVTADSPAETERIRRLLFKKLDLTAAVAAPAPEPAPASEPAPEPTPEPPSVQKPAPARDPEPEPVSEPEPASATAAAPDTSGKKGDSRPDRPVFSSIEIEDPGSVKRSMDPMQKIALVGIACLAFLFVLVFGASMKNSSRFYLKQKSGNLEVLRGKFAPKGVKEFLTLRATALPAHQRHVYTRSEAFSVIFNYYLNQADALLHTAGTPDFQKIRQILNRAARFAVSPALSVLIQKREATIDMMTLVYEADVLAGKNTAKDLSAARSALEKAAVLPIDAAEKALVKEKIQGVDRQLKQLKAPPASKTAKPAAAGK